MCICVCSRLVKLVGSADDHTHMVQEGGADPAPRRAARKDDLSSTSSHTETFESSKAACRERDTLKKVRRDTLNTERMTDNKLSLAPAGPLWQRTAPTDQDPSQAAEIRAGVSENAATAVSPLTDDNNPNSSALITTAGSGPGGAGAGIDLQEPVSATPGSGTVVQEFAGVSPDPRSRSRRSWIWNQFFVIEEYSGPEPVLIGRVRVPPGTYLTRVHYATFRSRVI